MVQCSKAGFPITKSELLCSVRKLVDELKKRDPDRQFPFTENQPSRHWFEAFMRRHPEITLRTPQNLSQLRASVCEKNILSWHAEIESYLKTHKFAAYPDKPFEFFDPGRTETDPTRPKPIIYNGFDVIKDSSRIFNADEAAFFINPRGEKVLVPRGEKLVYHIVNADEKECLTVKMHCNAAGEIVDPMIVYKYVRLPTEIAQSIPENWGVGRSENGWMTAEVFYQYLANVFYPWLLRNKIQLPVILFVDGHTSHQSLHTSIFCENRGIILVALFPNATHLIQPMDVAVFRTLKKSWKMEVNQCRHGHMHEELKKKDFASLLASAIKNSVTPKILENGFRKCGLFPWDAKAIDFSKLKSGTETEDDLQQGNKEVNEAREFLKLLEEEIVPEILLGFNNCIDMSQEDYEKNLNLKDASLFLFWRKLALRVKDGEKVKHVEEQQKLVEEQEKHIEEQKKHVEEQQLERNKNNTDNSSSLLPSSASADSITAVIDEDPAMSSAEKEALKDALDFVDQLDIDESDAQPSTSVTHQTRTQSNQTTPQKAGTSSATGDMLIPSPFKASLFWPEKPPEKQTRRKVKVPAVTSAESYGLYLKKKEDQKAEAARLKEERKRARLAKAAEKQSIKGKKPPPKKRQKKKESDVESEGSDVDGDLLEMSNAEEESDDEVKEFEELSYVIVQFEGEYFPGIVTEKHDDGAEVRLMTFAGLDWKWPEKDYDAFYPDEDIMQTIKVPKLKNSRGIYEVPEIKRYRTIK